MKHYEGNSIKARECTAKVEKKTVEKVTTGAVKIKKQSEFKKIATSMISEEVRSIKDHTIYQIIIPTIVDTISQIVKDSIDLTFHGEVRGSSKSSRANGGSRNASRVSYNSITDERRDDRHRPASFERYSYDDISFETRADAEKVLECLDDMVEQYGMVTVADLFEMSGVTGNGYTDRNYGWSSLRSATIGRVSADEWTIKMPRASVIR